MDELDENSYVFHFYPEFVAGDSYFYYGFVAYDGAYPPNLAELPESGAWYQIPVSPVAISDATIPAVQEGIRSVYPNPFKQGTDSQLTLSYVCAKSCPVVWKIFNIRGQLIYESRSISPASGGQELHWDGKDMRGKQSTSGVYLQQISLGSNCYRSKLLLSK